MCIETGHVIFFVDVSYKRPTENGLNFTQLYSIHLYDTDGVRPHRVCASYMNLARVFPCTFLVEAGEFRSRKKQGNSCRLTCGTNHVLSNVSERTARVV